ncbi:ATP-binding cassette domain-containing protein [Kitasatospora sp. NPDC002227]|uniref:ABC transporter ATP-binding protein n=1 Tax=Kitasatospora sp. NPDC002227 TaxID=3154773 RepID=UPI00332C61BB
MSRGGLRLTARGVVRRFGGVRAVDGVDLVAEPGRITALVGPNGAGKSTLFACLSGAERPDAGRVLLGGRDVTRWPPHRRARLGLARTFQQLAVFPSLTVAEHLRLGAEQAGRGAEWVPPAGALLELLGLSGVRDRRAAELGTGTLRMVELGRALAGGPEVLLLDEPAVGLDAAEAARLATVLRALAAEGLALLVVEHDTELVGALADVVYLLAAGRVAARGPAAVVLGTGEGVQPGGG